MLSLLRSTTAYRAIRAEAARGEFSQAALVLFPDGKYLGALLKECAKAFFGAEDGSRVAELIEKGSYSDALFFPAEGEKLTADDCSRILEEETLRPVEGERKLFVLGNFHAAPPLVQNKLLKSLEEPPVGVHFLLGAESESPVLPTVLSRVKRYAIPPFSEEQIAAALKRTYGGDVAAAAAASGGIFSVGENLLSDGGEEFRLAEEFLLRDENERFCRETGERKGKREFFAALKSLLRDALFFETGQRQYIKSAEGPASRVAAEYPVGALIKALELVGEAEKQILYNAPFGSCLYALAVGIAEERTKWQKLS